MEKNLMAKSMVNVINDYYILDNKNTSLIQKANAQRNKNDVLGKLGLRCGLKDCKQILDNILNNSQDATYQRYVEHLVFNHINLPKETKNANTGNFMVEDMYKVIKDYQMMKNNHLSSIKRNHAIDNKIKILKSLGLNDYNIKDCIQIVEEILDNGLDDLTPKECLEDLIVDRDLDLPKLSKNIRNEKATGAWGSTYNLQEAHAIISGVSNHTYFNEISDAFNYLELDDGNYLGTDDEDALYIHGNKHHLATLNDLYKEYNHAIKFIKNDLLKASHVSAN